MPKRKRDPAFLQMAAIAGITGLISIVSSIGIPIWAKLHGQPYRPEFSLFAAWGLAALGGAFACLNTYFLSDSTSKPPPKSGLALVPSVKTEVRAAANKADEPSQRRAA